jgi:hypothetical protein
MSRWNISDEDMNDLLEYLRKLKIPGVRALWFFEGGAKVLENTQKVRRQACPPKLDGRR